MSDANQDILARHEELATKRSIEEPDWRELAILLRPDDQDFNGTNKRRDDLDLYDSTPLYALDNFVGGMYGQSINPATRWFELSNEDDDLAAWQPVREWNYRVSNVLYGSMSPQVSNFYARGPSWIANLGTYGFGPFYQEEQVGGGRIIDTVIPIGESFLDRNVFGDYDTYHRKYKRTGRQLKQRFKAQAPAVNDLTDKDEFVVIHATYPNPDYAPGAFGSRGMMYRSCYVSPETRLRDFRVEEYYNEFPYHVPTWNERANSAYPTGPGRNQKADAQMLQEMEHSFIARAQFDAEPMLLLRSDTALTAADISPNQVLQGTMSDDGKLQAAWLEKKGNMQLAAGQSEQRRNAIRSAWYYGLMQIAMQRPQMTATEFLGLQEETIKLMAPNLVRVQTGGLSTFITRRYRILERAGQIPPAPPELARSRVTINYISPLAKVQMIAEGRGVLQLQEAIEKMAVTDPNVRDHFNGDVAAPVVAKAFSAVPSILRDPREIKQMREARAQQMAQQQQLMQTQQAVEIAATASHAQQAQTLAKARVKAA